MADRSYVGRPATELSELVRTGAVTALRVIEQHLERVHASGDPHGAFEHVVDDAARRDAMRIDALPVADRAALALAGVPVAIKDNVPVAGVPMHLGSRAAPRVPSDADHPVVARLRAAGAIVIGTTRVPELCLWGTSDNASGTARSPWRADRTAGGSSGGSAAAVASAFVPLAHGNDGLGSVRIPAACCGLVGIKPGPGVVPSALGSTSWYGLAENGALATTVADAALMLSVMADDPALARLTPPPRPLRIGLAMKPPVPGLRPHHEVVPPTLAVAGALRSLGHEVQEVPPPMPDLRIALATLGTWTAGARDEAEALAAIAPDTWRLLERRTRVHATVGRAARRLGLAEERHRVRWRRMMDEFFARFDVLLTPTLAGPPLAAAAWRSRGWLANMIANVRVAPYCGPVNFARLPAIAFPAGVHADGTPASAHLVGPGGSERLLLALAAAVEQTRRWTRHSPHISHGSGVTHGTTPRGGPS